MSLDSERKPDSLNKVQRVKVEFMTDIMCLKTVHNKALLEVVPYSFPFNSWDRILIILI